MFFRGYKVTSILLAVVIVAINIFFVADTIMEENFNVLIHSVIYVLAVGYFALIVYTVVHMFVSIAGDKYNNVPWVQKYVSVPLNENNRNHTI